MGCVHATQPRNRQRSSLTPSSYKAEVWAVDFQAMEIGQVMEQAVSFQDSLFSSVNHRD